MELAHQRERARYQRNAERFCRAKRAKDAGTPLNELLFKRVQSRAKRDGIVFALRVEDVVVPEFCPVLGIRLERSRRNGPEDNSPSLDRIRPELGYVPGNVAVVSQRANRLKNNGTAEEHEAIARFIRIASGPA